MIEKIVCHRCIISGKEPKSPPISLECQGIRAQLDANASTTGILGNA
jgi:hypothetical protein